MFKVILSNVGSPLPSFSHHSRKGAERKIHQISKSVCMYSRYKLQSFSRKHRSNRMLPGTDNITLGFLATTRGKQIFTNFGVPCNYQRAQFATQFSWEITCGYLAQNCQYLEYIKKLHGNVLSSSHQLKYLGIPGSLVLTNYTQYHHKTCRAHILTSQHDQIKSSHRLNTA